MTQAKRKEPTLIFNKRAYPIKSLSKEARDELKSLKFAESEVNRLKAKLAVAQTAVNAYSRGLAMKLQNADKAEEIAETSKKPN